ncbi:prepilin peptidase [Candidatus Microgenomates bacterium]|nr:MAG: prepilin peptidase [Candidatus Microgenomates bacterium]
MIIFLFILGLCIGSFLNVLIDRLPRNETILKGRSHCENCKKKLAWHDLIPLLSFVLLKGKCRYCKSPISLYYPVVELMTGVLFVLVAINFQFSIFNFQSNSNFQIFNSSLMALIFQLFIISSLIVVFFTDLKYGIIPDKIIIPSILISLFYFFIIYNSLFISHLISGIGAFLFFLLLFLITRGKGMGFGDVKFSFLMGLFLGYPKIGVAFYIAFLTGAFVSLILISWRKKEIKATIPFGPFLVIGTLVSMFAGEFLISKIFYFLIN